MSVVVYTKPACMQCKGTQKALNNAGVEFEIVTFPSTMKPASMSSPWATSKLPLSSPKKPTGAVSALISSTSTLCKPPKVRKSTHRVNSH